MWFLINCMDFLVSFSMLFVWLLVCWSCAISPLLPPPPTPLPNFFCCWSKWEKILFSLFFLSLCESFGVCVRVCEYCSFVWMNVMKWNEWMWMSVRAFVCMYEFSNSHVVSLCLFIVPLILYLGRNKTTWSADGFHDSESLVKRTVIRCDLLGMCDIFHVFVFVVVVEFRPKTSV